MSLAEAKQRQRSAAKVIALSAVLVFAGLVLPAGMLFARNNARPDGGWTSSAQSSPPYAGALAPLLANVAADDAALLLPLAQQLIRLNSVPIADARAQYADALNRFSWPGTYRPVPSAARLWRRPTGVELSSFLDTALSALAREARGRLINCSQDLTLPATGAAAHRVALLSNLRQAGGVAPNMVLQLLHTVLWLPPGAAYVGIYEDGSSDDTRRWLGLLQLLLIPLGVPITITINGTLKRHTGEHRIAHLSRLRNQLIAPLFDNKGVVGGSPGGRNSARSPSSTSTEGDGVSQFVPDQVLFINDVFWCRDDALRLLLHDADLACGYDVHQPGHHLLRARQRKLSGVAEAQWSGRLSSDLHQPPSPSRRRVVAQQQSSVSAAPTPTPTPKPKPKLSYWFYDIWVGRDVSGARLMSGGAPFTQHPPSRARALEGLPFPIYCGWNGAVKITAGAFRRGLRFRAHMPGECRASECSLLCNDMARLGLKRALLDPTVAVSYQQDPKAALYTDPPGHWTAATGIPLSSWRDVSSAPPVDWSSPKWAVNYSSVECCGLDEGRDLVDWDKGCHQQDVMAINFTAAWLQQQGFVSEDSGGSSSIMVTSVVQPSMDVGTVGD